MSKKAERLYLILAALFISSLVAGNLMFQKFFSWNFFGWHTFELSVGILPYPITFLITDLISEIYGKRRANQVVVAGLVSTAFVLGLVVVSSGVEATSWSPVSDDAFNNVFGLTAAAVTASMVAYLLAQLIDIRIYHFWKKLTKGKHLWLRNNASTITSQMVDTASVLFLLCFFGAIKWELFSTLFWSGFLFKLLVAACDTPLLYLGVFIMKRYLGLKGVDEVEDAQ